MTATRLILSAGFIVCAASCLVQFYKVISRSRRKPYSKALGKRLPGVLYSLSGAMSPVKKETAYLHFPTYSAGILFHLGTFACFVILVLEYFNITFSFSIVVVLFLFITSASGFFMLIKRILLKKMRSLSNPDDYFSNLLVTFFHLVTAFVLLRWVPQPVYFLYSAFLLIYIPVGKLRHLVYFFTSRYHLGIFYGWRGVWPIKRERGLK